MIGDSRAGGGGWGLWDLVPHSKYYLLACAVILYHCGNRFMSLS